MPKSGSSHIKVSHNYISEKVNSIPPSGIRKFFDLLSSMEGVISLGVGEPDFVTPWHIREAAIYSLEKGYTMYTSNHCLPQLRQELAKHLESRHCLSYNPDNEILITVGVSEGLDLALRAILEPGDEVIMPDPSYVAYPACTTLADGTPILVPTTEDNDFKIKADDIEQRITQKTKAILIGYPANPTGATMPKEELAQIAELARQHDLLVIFDQVYERLVYGIEHTCFASLPGMWERTILLSGFSKAFAMTGWRLGYVCAPKPLSDQIVKIHQYSMMCASIMSQIAAIEACRNGDDEVKKMLDEYRARREVIVEGFNRLGMDCLRPEGAFYAFPSIKKFGLSSEEFCERLLNEEKVALVPGNSFGRAGEGHIRCSFSASRERIRLALEGLGRFLKRL